jgi:hypothetical protein
MSDELGKEETRSCFKVLFKNLPGGTVKACRKSQNNNLPLESWYIR